MVENEPRVMPEPIADDGPLVVGIDTCLVPGGISLFANGILLEERALTAEFSHSITLLKQLDTVLAKFGRTVSDVTLFAVGLGPGSFTGLRIGLATVLGLNSAMGVEHVGVPTLEALAFGAGLSKRTMSMIPAGRGEVF